MNFQTLDVKNKGSMDDAVMHLYLIEDSRELPDKERPVVVVCPGGGYSFTSDREADMIALQFLAMGYHAAVLRYSVAPAVYPAAILELGKGVKLLRQNAEAWNIEENGIIICGFSAGGHLAASYCMFWNQDWMGKELEASPEDLRPNGMILGYPVITSGDFAHHDSFRNLLGESYQEKKDEMSLEFKVGEQVPRSFIWHTYEDAGVPVQNSLLLVDELVKNHVSTEFHMFERGAHGLALANRLTGNPGYGREHAASSWVELAHQWIENR